MNCFKRNIGFLGLFLLVCGFMASGTTGAFAKDDLSSTLTAYKIVSTPGGKEKIVPADKAKPGEVIDYQAVYRNNGKGNLENIKATLPIPVGTEYLPGSDKPAAETASLDGKNFEPLPLIRKQASANGRITQIQVPYSEYRYLRWIVKQLEPGKEVTLKARVKISQAATPSIPAKKTSL
jgi:uncharacterized repeat protein (TIGR01451 family)